MAPDNEESLEHALEHAESELRSALDSACASDVDDVDTGELIRIEEVLAIANEAAKEAVSLRRRRRRDSQRRPSEPSPTTERPPDGRPPHRRFTDAAGKQWNVFAVLPAQGARASLLPEAYRDGWLAFESGAETRRLAPIPNGWTSSSDATLAKLNERAEPSGRVTKRPNSTRDTNA